MEAGPAHSHGAQRSPNVVSTAAPTSATRATPAEERGRRRVDLRGAECRVTEGGGGTTPNTRRRRLTSGDSGVTMESAKGPSWVLEGCRVGEVQASG